MEQRNGDEGFSVEVYMYTNARLTEVPVVENLFADVEMFYT